jgi:hypothetical protein
MQPLSNPSSRTIHLFSRGDRIAEIVAARTPKPRNPLCNPVNLLFSRKATLAGRFAALGIIFCAFGLVVMVMLAVINIRNSIRAQAIREAMWQQFDRQEAVSEHEAQVRLMANEAAFLMKQEALKHGRVKPSLAMGNILYIQRPGHAPVPLRLRPEMRLTLEAGDDMAVFVADSTGKLRLVGNGHWE